jgi:hypothetical protein
LYLSDHQKVHNFFVNEFGQLKNIYQDVPDDEHDIEDLVEESVTSDIETVDDFAAFGVTFN